MTLVESQSTASDCLSQIEVNLDLSMVRLKLAKPEEGQGWTPDQLDLAEGEYRKFLALCIAHPKETIVPCRLVDQFWHQHILDTSAYREDCQRLFGFFYDHYPYFGLNGPDDAASLEAAYEVTLNLYELNFGEPPRGAWKGDAKEKCRTGCKPMKCR
jgi:hypothetical protein